MRRWLALCLVFLSACMQAARPPKLLPQRGQPHERALAATVSIQSEYGSGSGIAWDADSIVTAAHVVLPPSAMLIRTRSGTLCKADRVTVSTTHDVAIIDVSGCVLHPLERAAPVVGAAVWVAGHPLNLRWSLSRGVVSAVRHDDYLQLDAAVNPGNSGGPVVDTHGRLVGMVTGIMSPDRVFSGISWGLTVGAMEEALGE